eukprot:2122367-Amphidinium_carterae.1
MEQSGTMDFYNFINKINLLEDDEIGKEGFLEEFQDTFWVHDEAQSSWIQRRFGGRFMRKASSKGKGKGKRNV